MKSISIARPKFRLPEGLLSQWADVFQSSITLIYPLENMEFPRDPKDSKFLECVISSQADYFITGDRDFSEAPNFIRSKICSVNQFYSRVIDVGV